MFNSENQKNLSKWLERISKNCNIFKINPFKIEIMT